MVKNVFLLLSLCFSTLLHAEVLLKDMQGRDVSFSALKGKWVFINYWAEWCATCVEEIPELNHFYRKHQHDAIALFAFNYDELPVSKQKRLIKKLNIQYPSLLSNPAFALGLGDIRGVPVTFIFSPDGKLANTLYGGQNVHSLERAIAEK